MNARFPNYFTQSKRNKHDPMPAGLPSNPLWNSTQAIPKKHTLK